MKLKRVTTITDKKHFYLSGNSLINNAATGLYFTIENSMKDVTPKNENDCPLEEASFNISEAVVSFVNIAEKLNPIFLTLRMNDANEDRYPKLDKDGYPLPYFRAHGGYEILKVTNEFLYYPKAVEVSKYEVGKFIENYGFIHTAKDFDDFEYHEGVSRLEIKIADERIAKPTQSSSEKNREIEEEALLNHYEPYMKCYSDFSSYRSEYNNEHKLIKEFNKLSKAVSKSSDQNEEIKIPILKAYDSKKLHPNVKDIRNAINKASRELEKVKSSIQEFGLYDVEYIEYYRSAIRMRELFLLVQASNGDTDSLDKIKHLFHKEKFYKCPFPSECSTCFFWFEGIELDEMRTGKPQKKTIFKLDNNEYKQRDKGDIENYGGGSRIEIVLPYKDLDKSKDELIEIYIKEIAKRSLESEFTSPNNNSFQDAKQCFKGKDKYFMNDPEHDLYLSMVSYLNYCLTTETLLQYTLCETCGKYKIMLRKDSKKRKTKFCSDVCKEYESKHPNKGKFKEERIFYKKYLTEFNEETIIGVPTYSFYPPLKKHGKIYCALEDGKMGLEFYARKAKRRLKSLVG
jgi:hypothetical protein